MTNGEDHDEGSLLALALLALVAGVLAGIVGASFRLSLVQADRLRNALIEWAHGQEAVGFLVVLAVCAGATAIAAWLVRRYSPHAAGSGIPHVEAVLRGELPPIPFRLIPVKFFGGLFAIGAGLALGREGPTVQMGASLAHLVGKIFGRSWADCRVLIAAGAGAGLGTAFNAPIAGAVFVLEELVARFERRIAIAALAASATAIGVARLLTGDAPDFYVGGFGYGDAETRPLYFVFGALAGLLAVAYDRLLLATRAAARRLIFARVDLRGALVGAAVGALGWFAPNLTGGGDAITQSVLTGSAPLIAIPAAFLIRFALGASVLRRGSSGRSVRPDARPGGAIRVPVRSGLPRGRALSECSAGGVCGGRHSRVLHRRRPGPYHRNRARHGNDGQRDDAAADVMRMLNGDAGGDHDEGPAHLRIASGARLAGRQTDRDGRTTRRSSHPEESKFAQTAPRAAPSMTRGQGLVIPAKASSKPGVWCPLSRHTTRRRRCASSRSSC